MTSKKQGDGGSHHPPRPPRTPTPPGSGEYAPGADSTVLTEGNGDDQADDFFPTAPITPSPGLLSPAHQRFCQEYTIDLNASKAYQRSYPDADHESARRSGSLLLSKPDIQREIQRLLDERAQVTGITADRVLLHFWQAGTADPRELMEIRIGCCRHCWGEYHQWQYTDAELERAEHEHIQNEAKRRKAEAEGYVPKAFHGKGGGGYKRDRQPNPECPECAGDGKERHIIKDTRNLSPGAARLFGGLKIDKSGNMTVLIRDPLEPLKKVGEHLGMWSDKLPGPQESNPFQALLEELRGRTGTAAALPIVHHDPELKPQQADIEDAQIKPTGPAKPPKPRPTWRAKS